MLKTFRQYRALNHAIVLYASGNPGGAWRSITTYHRHAELQGDAIKMINRHNQRTFRQLLMAMIATPILLLNGLDSFRRWEALVVLALRRSTVVYLHETSQLLDQFQKEHPFRGWLLSRLLSRRAILAPSESAANLYRQKFRCHRVKVVYECLPSPIPLEPSPGTIRICMVGTIESRKGVTLFSRVADAAHEKGFPWEFHWAGGQGSEENLYRSENVRWWGWTDQPGELIRRCDLFFLSSIDDPFPLAVLEALRENLRCVAYAGTGSAEILLDLDGCEIFEDHTTAQALAAIEKALNLPTNPRQIDALFKERLGVSAFRKHLHRCLDQRRWND